MLEKGTQLLIALFTIFTLTLLVNFEFGKDWLTVATISKPKDYENGKNSLDRTANPEMAVFLVQMNSGMILRKIPWNNVVWSKPLYFSMDVTWPKIWKPGRKVKLKGSMDKETQDKAQHKGAMLNIKTQLKCAMSMYSKTQHKGAMSSSKMAQHKDAMPFPCKEVKIKSLPVFKAQPIWVMPLSKVAQHEGAMPWFKAQHTGAMPREDKLTHTKLRINMAQCLSTTPWKAQHNRATPKTALKDKLLRTQHTLAGLDIYTGETVKEKFGYTEKSDSLINYRRMKTRLKGHRSMCFWSFVGCPFTIRMATGLWAKGRSRWRQWSYGLTLSTPGLIGRCWGRVRVNLVINLHNPCAMWDGPELGNASLKQILIQILSRWKRTGRRGRKLTAIFMSALDLGLHLTGKDMQPAQLPITGTNTSTGIDCMSGQTKYAPIKHKPALCGRYEVNVPRSHWIIIKKTKNRHVQIIQSKILLRSHDWISSQVRVELIFEHIEETANHSTNEEIHGRTCWHLRTIHEHNYERRHCEKGVGKKDVELGGNLNENLKNVKK